MRRGVTASRVVRVAALATAVLVALLVLLQFVLPGIAASTVRSRVRRYGTVLAASVSAFPAVELLWGSAEQVTVRAGSLRLTPAQSARLVWEGHGVARVDASVARLQLGPLQLTDAVFVQRGSRLRGEASISPAAVRAALPARIGVRLLSSGAGRVRVRVSGGLFGVGGSVDAVALGEGGALVARAEAPLLGALKLTLFSDPHIYVLGVGARPLAGGAYRLSMTARLR
jgi:hypothetical protein